MPTSVGTSLFAFAAVLTTVSDTAGAIVAGVALAWETYIFGRGSWTISRKKV